MKKIVLFFLLLALAPPATPQAAEYELLLKSSYLDWTERSPSSRKDPFVKEFGLVYSLGGNVLFRPTENLFLKTEIEGYWGNIGYEGVYLTNYTPNETNGSRLGGILEETLGYKFKVSNDLNLYPFASLGFSTWLRGVSAETWLTGYGRLGLQAEYGMFFGRAGVLFPSYTETTARFKDIPWLRGGRETRVTVNPKGIPTPFAEIGIRHKRLTLSFSYELKKWQESDGVNLEGGIHVFQPETTQNLSSIWLRYSF